MIVRKKLVDVINKSNLDNYLIKLYTVVRNHPLAHCITFPGEYTLINNCTGSPRMGIKQLRLYLHYCMGLLWDQYRTKSLFQLELKVHKEHYNSTITAHSQDKQPQYMCFCPSTLSSYDLFSSRHRPYTVNRLKVNVLIDVMLKRRWTQFQTKPQVLWLLQGLVDLWVMGIYGDLI